jgi:hypothetical protein
VKTSLFIVGLLQLSILTLVATPTKADTCRMPSMWSLIQANGYRVEITDVAQNANGQISGYAWHAGQRGVSNFSGKMDGYSDFHFTVHWVNGAIGRYTGSVMEDNFARGKTAGVKWHSLDTFKCD